MKLFDVYPLFPITPVEAKGCLLWDENGNEYLDLYGGHAVISVGHGHPKYIKTLKDQLDQIGFYSNSVEIPQQQKLASLLGELSGYEDYSLFLCNSGAEANENAMKLASFHTGRKKIIAFEKSFHGRTSAAVEATDDINISAPLNHNSNVFFCEMNNKEMLEAFLQTNEIAAVIIEGIQGVGGVVIPEDSFLNFIREKCDEYGSIFICDEIQSGYCRSGKFFAHQYANVSPDIITVAKGMGNGFPVAGVLISPKFQAKSGMLGTTFGGNYLACAAAISVLEIIREENLLQNAAYMGEYLINALKTVPGIKNVRGRGLMIGISFEFPAATIRKTLLDKYKIFTGNASDKNTIRILPPLNIGKKEIDMFITALNEILKEELVPA